MNGLSDIIKQDDVGENIEQSVSDKKKNEIVNSYSAPKTTNRGTNQNFVKSDIKNKDLDVARDEHLGGCGI